MKNIKIKELPIISEKNFDDFINKHVVQKKYDEYHFKGIEKPRNSKDFREFTKRIYGVELDVECFAYPSGAFSRNDGYGEASYKVIYDDRQDEYSKNPIYKLWDKKYSQYDGLKVLLDWCFGDVFCGGVAGAHYGQTVVPTKTDYLRISRWGDNERNYKKSAIKQHNSLVDIFGFNPF